MLSSKRAEIKRLIATLKETFNDVDKSIMNAARNVNLDAILEYQKDGVKHNFLDEY